MNAFTSFTLTVVLFFVFCTTESPVELLVKCVAINFVIEIDNSWTSEAMRRNAIENFKTLQSGFSARGDSQTTTSVKVQIAFKVLNVGLRAVGTLFMGLSLGLLFFFARQDDMCLSF